jgi:ankyrin repeat protein
VPNGWTNLVWVCSDRSQCGPAYINQLIQYGVDINLKQSHENYTPLYMACSQNKIELVKLLLDKGADPNLPGPNPPVEACLRLRECLQLLISAGADVHSNKNLMEKATYFNQIEVVKVLLDGGVNPSPEDEYYTPLNTSIRDTKFDITALLLSRGADPNAEGGEGFPIQVAATKPEALKLLIGAGVDLMKSGVLETAVYRHSIESIPILLDAGYPIGGLPDDYYRPLNTAVRDNQPEYLELLLSRGADPNLGGGEGTPLMLAANKPAILKQLLAGGADITKVRGVLESAVYKNSIESISILLDAGDPINGGPDDYYRPLHTAVRDNHPDIVALLLSKGADPNQKGQILFS